MVGVLFLVNSWILVELWARISPVVWLDKYPSVFPIIRFIVEWGVTLTILILAYRIVHYAKRIVVLKQIIEYSSFTKYSFWKRYNIKKVPHE